MTLVGLLARLHTEGGALVSSAKAHPIEIADAQRRGDMHIDEKTGLGFIRRTEEWLDHVTNRIEREG